MLVRWHAKVRKWQSRVGNRSCSAARIGSVASETCVGCDGESAVRAPKQLNPLRHPLVERGGSHDRYRK